MRGTQGIERARIPETSPQYELRASSGRLISDPSDVTELVFAAAKTLAKFFVDNFKKYEAGASEAIRAAGPRL